MVVQPDFLDHWKTKTLEGLLRFYRENHGLTLEVLSPNLAPLLVLRLWFHCQNRKAWVFPKMTPEMLSGVCHWPHNPQWLHGALLQCGFIAEEEADGVPSIRVHDWEHTNASLVASWDRGRFGKLGGRPKKHEQTSKVSGDNLGQTSGEPEKRREDKRGTPVVPDGDEALLISRVKSLFGKPNSRPLDAKQAEAWKKKKGAVAATTDDEWQLLEWWFKQPDGEGEIAQYRKTTLTFLLNGWEDEILKAQRAAAKANFTVQTSEKKEGGGYPADWRELLTAHDPEFSLPDRFDQLPASAQSWVRQAAQKKEGARE